MLGYGNYKLALDVLSIAIKSNPYIAGKRFTIDNREGDQEYVARLFQRQAFKRAQELDETLIKETNSV
ncbi:hypothetical protein [Microbulbifer sp. A4B17]|uniref:hypothetical protein n=1 Tax=Microbulbifer sp. A4B17 TaxID=359370 RepID=UPI00192E1F35|nr:hypothetical protein [Microbulbifer sp. A4B17]